MKAASLLAGLAGLAALTAAGPAFGYCRTSHCPATGEEGQVCTPASADDCGFVIYWTKPRITYSVQVDASVQVPFETIRGVLRTAFETWTSADCGGASPRIEIVEAEPAACRRQEYNRDRGNANVVLFHDDVWPYGEDDGRLALTTVSYDTETGEIYDADIELNAAHAIFTTGEDLVQVDLLSIVTHEAGHFLGLAHSSHAEASMIAGYPPNSITLRDLCEDDRAAICAAHPPAPITKGCDPTPRHGFSALCSEDQPVPVVEPEDEDNCCCPDGYTCETGVCVEAGCCTVAPGRGGSRSGGWAGALAAVGALLLGARRRAARRRVSSAEIRVAPSASGRAPVTSPVDDAGAPDRQAPRRARALHGA
jgi:hypothetical protein